MLCESFDAYSNEINCYFNTDVSGYPFVANVDNQSVYNEIVSKIKADKSTKTLLSVSSFCKEDNLPNTSALYSDASKQGNYVVIGLSQFLMLQGFDVLKKEISKLLQMSISGHTVFLLNGCGSILKERISSDLRLVQRVAIGNSDTLDLPEIVLVSVDNDVLEEQPCVGMHSLLLDLENGFSMEKEDHIIFLQTKFPITLFEKSMYSVSSLGELYEIMKQQYKEIASSTERSWGTDEQWKDLLSQLKSNKTLSRVIDEKIGSTVNLSSYIDERFENEKSLDAWYLWLAMKVFGVKENSYLTIVTNQSNSIEGFIDLIYMELLHHNCDDPDFEKLYRERKSLIERLPESMEKVQNYCDHVGEHEKKAIYYLTDLSDTERRQFFISLNAFKYSEDEIRQVTKLAFPELYYYMQEYKFTVINTPVPSGDEELRTQLTEYFNEYKLQKVTNKIHPDFLEKVQANAVDRPFNKLLPRTSILNDIDKKNSKVYFFDALGVEYLSYITEKCEKYKLQATIHVAHCELPSITSTNLDFYKFFKPLSDENEDNISLGTKELDELKHHSKDVDYRSCPEPVYLFRELEIINKELRHIRDILTSGKADKIVVVSDHGASRLSVLHQHECAFLELEEKGEHSGRCCKSEENPNFPETAYENGYAILGNYDRFKGSRKANVEVHGGASLEETVIPVIEITRMPEKQNVYITNDFIEFHNKELVSIIIFSSEILKSPHIIVKEIGDQLYECVTPITGKNYKFEIPEIKRSGSYTVDLFDGDKPIVKDLSFKTKKATSTTKEFF